MHSYNKNKRKGKEGYCVVKLDVHKADRGMEILGEDDGKIGFPNWVCGAFNDWCYFCKIQSEV